MYCGRCGQYIVESSVDQRRHIATCSHCGNVTDLLATGGAGASMAGKDQATTGRESASFTSDTGAVNPRRELPLPSGITVQESGGAVVIVRRWWRSKHVVLCLLVGAALVYVITEWVAYFGGAELPALPVLILTPLVMWCDFMIFVMMVNRTTVTVKSGSIDVRTAPLRLPMFPDTRVSVEDLVQLFVVKEGGHYAVMAESRFGQVTPLVRPLKQAEHALFMEKRVELALGIVDRRATGEISRDDGPGARYTHVSGVTPLGEEPSRRREPPTAPSQRGFNGLILLPIGIGGLAVGGMVFMFSSEVEGSLSGQGAAGEWSLTPNACSSGQTLGFYGVELSDEKNASVRIRLMQDAVGLPQVAVLRSGQAPEVITSAECPGMRLGVVRTNNVTNDVNLVEGSAKFACPVLSGSVKYERCGL